MAKETGCFVIFKSLSDKCIYKNLTAVLLFVAFFSSSAFSAILVEERFNTHLRWSLHVDKKEVLITKTGRGFYIETFQLPLYRKMRNEMERVVADNDHFGQISFNSDGYPKKPAQIRVNLKDETIELFSFYRLRDKKYILDFWKNGNSVKIDRKISHHAPEKVAKNKKTKIQEKSNVLTKERGKTKDRIRITKKRKPKYRDFRYGASLIWDYPALSPKIKGMVDIERKTPEYFYPIQDRDIEGGDDREAHLQLSINLYKRGKYGFMAKSIKLYGQKYGIDKNSYFNDFLRALALIKENLGHGNRGAFKSAIAILNDITDRTKDYYLKRGIYIYKIQYLMHKKNMIEALRTGKRLYVESRIASDQKAVDYAAQVILYTLSHLGQVEKIKKFARENTMHKLIAPQTLLSYQVFVNHKEDKIEKVISLFQKNKNRMEKPINPSILYNVAEAYFRGSQYKKAIRLYQTFLKNYNYMREASFARVRLALSYEILESDLKKTIDLYEDAINLSSHPRARYEAKLRYVALRNTRKITPNKDDEKVLSFLEHSNEEKLTVNKDLKTLLWLVRLRTFINMGNYKSALSYITALPVNTLKPAVRRMFEGDGAEIIYGIITSSFDQGEFTRVVKLWEIYRDIYEDKVAGRPYLNFIVARSYIDLGLEDSSERILANLMRIKKAPPRRFPIWVSRVNYGGVNNLLNEINIFKMIRKKDWNYIVKNINKLNITKERKLFYNVVAFYHLKQFNRVIKDGEEFLRTTAATLPLSKSEISQFFEAYLESIYESNNLEKFKQVAKAVLEDIDRSGSNHKNLKGLSEKTEYLLIELLASSDINRDRGQVQSYVIKFLEKHNNSIYTDRVKFLLASTFIKSQKVSDGLKILNQLVASDGTADHIREMSKVEIASLRLDEKIIN